MRDHILLFLNGQQRKITGHEAFLTLSTWLREHQRAVGTKVVCEEGDCGACTVLVGRLTEGGLQYTAVNSCIQLVAQLDATHVVTVEGVSRPGELSRIQQEMVDHHGAQCGYCTPGFIVAMHALAEEKSAWQPADVRDALTGNLCRCTGYEPIIKAAMAASGAASPSLGELYPEQPLIEALSTLQKESVAIDVERRRFFTPATLSEALRIKSEHPESIIVQGGTDVGVLANKRGFTPPTLLNLSHIDELYDVQRDGQRLVVGANTTLSRLEREVREDIPELYEILRVFGSPQIRNAGTVAGNIANGSPIADLLPFLFVAGAEIELTSTRGTRRVDINAFYKGYKTLDRAPEELITRVFIPIPRKDETLKLYKVSKRHDLDISAFTAALRMSLRDRRMRDVRVAFGGIAATVVRMPQIESMLEGNEPSEELFRRAGVEARGAIKPLSDVRGSADFRLQLAENIMLKFYFDVTA